MKHDSRAGYRQRQSEYDPAREGPAHPVCDGASEQRYQHDLTDCAWQRDASYGEKFGQREMQAHAEHQKYDANFGELRRQRLVRDISGGKRPDDHASDEIAYERR